MAARKAKRSSRSSRTSGRGVRTTKHASGAGSRKVGDRPARKRKYALLMTPGLGALVGGSERLSKTSRDLANNVIVTVTPKTISNERIQAHRGSFQSRSIEDFRPRPAAEDGAVKRLRQLGFEIVHRGEFGIVARAPAELVSDVLKIEMAVHAKPRRTPMRATQSFSASFDTPACSDLFVAPVQSLTVKCTISKHIDDFVFMPPADFCTTPAPVEPNHDYFAIGKNDIRRLLTVPPGGTGAGATVGMVDSGFFPHPYYAANNLDYRPTVTPSIPDPTFDFEGHGTAMAYNTFAVAPGTRVKGFKRIFGAEQTALDEAGNGGVDIVSCAWGFPGEQRMPLVEASITSLLAKGKIVLFASGDGVRCWPASMPGVLAVGGVYADQQNQLEASNYSSGFPSGHPEYGNRAVPDICGLCGQRPNGIYITLPCPPGSELDQGFAGNSFPNRDETLPGDGWFNASGTSSATAQIAGVVALMVQRARALGRPPLTTARVKETLQQTATPVQRGMNAQGFPATGHPNIAVGFGLVNAAAAIDRV